MLLNLHARDHPGGTAGVASEDKNIKHVLESYTRKKAIINSGQQSVLYIVCSC